MFVRTHLYSATSSSSLLAHLAASLRYTIGYVVDRKVGNTGGLGGLYGILYAIGRPLPFREARPWTPSLPYRAFQAVGGFIARRAS